MLAKVGKAKFYLEVRPGDVIRYRSDGRRLARRRGDRARRRRPSAANCSRKWNLCSRTSTSGSTGVDLFYPADFLAILRMLGVYDVGRKPDGTPLEVPPHLLEAEMAANESAVGEPQLRGKTGGENDA